MRMDRRSDPELLRTLLDPVFDNPVERRPHPAALLRMLRADGPLPPLADPEAGLRPGYDIFEQTCMRKRGPQAPDPPTTQFPRPPVNRNRLAIPLLTTMILVAMLIVGVAVLV